MEIRTQSRAGGDVCLGVPALVAGRLVGRLVGHRCSGPVVVGRASSLSGHRWLLLACLMSLASALRCRGCGGGVIASSLCGCRAACRIARAGRAASFSSPCCVLRACLPCDSFRCRIARLPVSSTRRAGRCFGVPAVEWSFLSVSHRLLIGVSARFGFACSFYPYRRRVGCAYDAVRVCERTGAGGEVCSLAWCRFRHSYSLPPSYYCCFASSRCHALSLFPFLSPYPLVAGFSLLAGLV